MFFPIRTDIPLRRTPWMNWLLIAINLLIYFVQIYAGGKFTRRFELDPRDPQLLHFITYAFLHANLLHVLSNMLFLYIFGNNVNDRMGSIGYLAFYLAGAVMAGVTHVLLENAPVIGASGAVFAVTGAFLILFPRSHITIVYFFILIGVIELASMWFILAYFVINVVNQFSQTLGAQSAVANGAHIGGAIFGMIICLMLLALRLLPRNQFDLLALIDRWNRRRQYREIVAAGYNPFAAQMAEKQDPRDERLMEIRAAVSEALAHGNKPEAIKQFMTMRAIAPAQTLSRQNQLDIANHLFETDHYAAAADAYENFVHAYPKADNRTHVLLLLGLINARYLNRPERAEPYLKQVIDRVHEGRDLDLARAELEKIRGNA